MARAFSSASKLHGKLNCMTTRYRRSAASAFDFESSGQMGIGTRSDGYQAPREREEAVRLKD